MLRNCPETALKLRRGSYQTALNWLWNSVCIFLFRIWTEIALKLLWNCSEINSSETALKLPLNCPETTLKLLWNCSVFELKLPWICTESAFKLRCVNLSRFSWPASKSTPNLSQCFRWCHQLRGEGAGSSPPIISASKRKREGWGRGVKRERGRGKRQRDKPAA